MSETVPRPIASGSVAEVFAHGSRVLKLYKRPEAKAAAFREAACHAAVEATGLPVPAVWGVEQVGDRWGVVFDRIAGPPFYEQMRAVPERSQDYLERIVRLQLAIHAQSAIGFPSLKPRLAARVAAALHIEASRRQFLLAGLAALSDGDRLCHGDFHPLNILGDIAAPMIIDWPDATQGDPAADCCRSYLILGLHAEELAAPYLKAYVRLGGVSRDRILAWLPGIAAARLVEEVPGERERLLAMLASSVRRGSGLAFAPAACMIRPLFR